MLKPRLQSPFRKATARDTARLRRFTMHRSSVCPWQPGLPAGVYFAFHRRRVVYIGQSVDVAHRLKVHGPRRWSELRFLPLAGREVLHGVESAFIAFFQPRYNGQNGAFFDEAGAAVILRAFGFLPAQRAIRRFRQSGRRPPPKAVDMRIIWFHLDNECRKLLIGLARGGPRAAPKPKTDGVLYKRIALKSIRLAGTSPPHVKGRRGRERLVWIEKGLVPTILRLAANGRSDA